VIHRGGEGLAWPDSREMLRPTIDRERRGALAERHIRGLQLPKCLRSDSNQIVDKPAPISFHLLVDIH
jgi:hypothetical protein